MGHNDYNTSKLAVSANLSIGVTVPVMFLSDGWSTNAVMVFVVIGVFVSQSPLKTGRGLEIASFADLSTCIVKRRKRMRAYVVSMTTLLCFMNCNSIIGSVNFFITMQCFAKAWSPVLSIFVVVANSFSKWSSATCFWKFGGSSIFKILAGLFVRSCLFPFGWMYWHKLLSPLRHLLLGHSWNPEAHKAILFCVSELLFDGGSYYSEIGSSLTELFLIWEVATVRRGILSSRFRVAVVWLSVSWGSPWQFLELLITVAVPSQSEFLGTFP